MRIETRFQSGVAINMKPLAYLLLVFCFLACHSDSKTRSADSTAKKDVAVNTVVSKKSIEGSTFKPYKLNENYMVIDTGFLDLTVMEGVYAVVTRNNKLADTIDKDYGIQKIDDDSYLYLTVTGTGVLEANASGKAGYKKQISGLLGDYVITIGNKKQKLSTLTTDFNDYFSSPSVINGKIYFWQIKKIGTDGNNTIAAAVYDPTTKQTISHYIKDDFIETDNAGYFAAPYIKKDTIYFDGENDKLKKFDKDLKSYN